MSGSIAGLLGALDQQQQQQNQIQQPAVLGLLGNATQQLLPTDPFAAQRAAAAAQAAQTPAPATPISARQSVNDWAASQNKNAYGTANPMLPGDFPQFTDPRLIQGRLADMAQGTVKVPGVSQQDAEDEFWRQMYGRRPGWGGGAGGWGGGMGGSDIAGNAASDAANNEINS
jgi:hypothetical protein